MTGLCNFTTISITIFILLFTPLNSAKSKGLGIVNEHLSAEMTLPNNSGVAGPLAIGPAAEEVASLPPVFELHESTGSVASSVSLAAGRTAESGARVVELSQNPASR